MPRKIIPEIPADIVNRIFDIIEAAQVYSHLEWQLQNRTHRDVWNRLGLVSKAWHNLVVRRPYIIDIRSPRDFDICLQHIQHNFRRESFRIVYDVLQFKDIQRVHREIACNVTHLAVPAAVFERSTDTARLLLQKAHSFKSIVLFHSGTHLSAENMILLLQQLSAARNLCDLRLDFEIAGSLDDVPLLPTFRVLRSLSLAIGECDDYNLAKQIAGCFQPTVRDLHLRGQIEIAFLHILGLRIEALHWECVDLVDFYDALGCNIVALHAVGRDIAFHHLCSLTLEIRDEEEDLYYDEEDDGYLTIPDHKLQSVWSRMLPGTLRSLHLINIPPQATAWLWKQFADDSRFLPLLDTMPNLPWPKRGKHLLRYLREVGVSTYALESGAQEVRGPVERFARDKRACLQRA